MSDWETSPAKLSLEEPNGALKDTANGHSNVESAPTDVVTSDQDKEEVVNFNPQDKGWVKPSKYDYDTYNRNIKPSDESSGIENGETQHESTNNGEVVPAFAPWAASAARYEWKEEYGDVAPAAHELEVELFGSEFRNRLGAKMESLLFEVEVESEEKVLPVTSFEDAGLHPVMLENIKLSEYKLPTPIQAYTIPAVLTGHDLIAVAQTGSGKTAAFLIPILSKLMGKAKKLTAPKPAVGPDFDPKFNGITAEPLVLVIVPTRELAVQIFDEARRLCYRSMLRPCVAYGGGPVRHQQYELARGCDILIGTPGRLIDFMGRGKTLSLRRVKYTVIDEADEMVGDDWSTELTELLSGGDNNEDADHRYLMFSATFPKAAQELAKKYLDDGNIRIKVGRAGSTHKNIFQHVIYAANDRKRDCLRDLLRSCEPIRTIIFVNAKHSADEVDDFLYNQGFPSTSIHSDRTQREREDALAGFRTGKTPILVTTGVTARGLDVFDVGHVINYDLPKADKGGLDEYVHRIGRTARIGHVGVATSFYNEDDEGIASKLVKLLVETEQKIPEFLNDFKPEEGKELDFEEDDDEGFNAGNEANGDDAGGWGNVDETANDGNNGWSEGDKTTGDDTWNSGAAETAETPVVENAW